MPNLSKHGYLGTIKKNRLLFYPVAVAAAVRVIGAVWLHGLLSQTGTLHTAWMDANPNRLARD